MLDDITKVYMEAGLTGLLICLALTGLVLFIKYLIKKSKADAQGKENAIRDKYKKELQTKDDEIIRLNHKIEKQKVQIETMNSLMQNNFEKLMTLSVDGVRELIKASFEEIDNKHAAERQLLGDQFKNNQVHKILNTLLINIGADRVSVFEYHNGGLNMKGTNFQKLSCTNQVVKNGISPTQTNFQNLFQSTFQFIVTELQQNKECFIPNIEDIKSEHYYTYRQLCSTGIKSAYYVCLKDHDIIIGFLEVCYITAFKYYDDTEIRELLKNYENQLEELM